MEIYEAKYPQGYLITFDFAWLLPSAKFVLQDVAEILANLSSASWADRKEGLTALQGMLRSSRVLK